MAAAHLVRIVRILDRAFLVIASAGLIAMMVHVALDILFSLILNAPIPVTSAFVTQYYMISVAFLPILAAEYRGGHIGVDMFTTAMRPRPRQALELIVLALSAAVYAMLTAQSVQQAMNMFSIKAYMVEQTTRILVWPSYFMLPLGFGAMTFLLSAKLYLRLVGKNELSASSSVPAPSKEVTHV